MHSHSPKQISNKSIITRLLLSLAAWTFFTLDISLAVDSDEPSRSSYFGIIDLAGFKKDRFFIYQARWRPDLPMAHIMPHWNWQDRLGENTPVHVYTTGDEAELFLNGQSLGRKEKGPLEYRLRWDDVKYAPGEIVSTDNGDPTDHTSFQSTTRAAFIGLALAIVRTKPGSSGPIIVRVVSEGLAPAEVTLNAAHP